MSWQAASCPASPPVRGALRQCASVKSTDARNMLRPKCFGRPHRRAQTHVPKPTGHIHVRSTDPPRPPRSPIRKPSYCRARREVSQNDGPRRDASPKKPSRKTERRTPVAAEVTGTRFGPSLDEAYRPIRRRAQVRRRGVPVAKQHPLARGWVEVIVLCTSQCLLW